MRRYPWRFFDFLKLVLVLLFFIAALAFVSVLANNFLPSFFPSLSNLFLSVFHFSFDLFILVSIYWVFFKRHDLSLSVVWGKLPSLWIVFLSIVIQTIMVFVFFAYLLGLRPPSLLGTASFFLKILFSHDFATLLRSKLADFLFWTDEIIRGVILASIWEELFFRGVLQNFLERRVKAVGAIILSSIIFGFFHLRLSILKLSVQLGVGFFSALSGSLLAAYLYHRTGSLTLAVILHSVSNLLALLLVLALGLILLSPVG